MNSAEFILKKYFPPKKVHFSAKFGSLNVQIRNNLKIVIFILCKQCKIFKYYVNSMVILCSTCQKEEKECIQVKYFIYAVLQQFKKNSPAKSVFPKFQSSQKMFFFRICHQVPKAYIGPLATLCLPLPTLTLPIHQTTRYPWHTLDYQVPFGYLGPLGTLSIDQTNMYPLRALDHQVQTLYLEPLGALFILCTIPLGIPMYDYLTVTSTSRAVPTRRQCLNELQKKSIA